MRLKGPFRKIFGMSKADHGKHAADGGVEYPVPFVHQNHINLCGDSSAQMLLMAHGKPASAALKPNAGHADSYRMQRNPRGVLEGAGDGPLVATVKAGGLRAWNVAPRQGPWNAAHVRALLDAFGPYAQSVQFSVAFHWVVVTGTDGRHVIYHDPWRGQNRRHTVAEWAQVAGDGIHAVVAPTVGLVEVPAILRATPR